MWDKETQGCFIKNWMHMKIPYFIQPAIIRVFLNQIYCEIDFTVDNYTEIPPMYDSILWKLDGCFILKLNIK